MSVMSASKRKRVVVSLQKKCEALERMDKGESMKKIAEEYGVGDVTVGDWKRNRVDLEAWKLQKSFAPTDRKTMKTSDYPKLGDALFLWFTQQREKGAPISGRILKAKAMSLRSLFPKETKLFKASNGWLCRWKKRYGVQQLNICGEKLSVDNSAVSKFKDQINQKIKDGEYSLEQIYSCVETSLNYKMLSSNTFGLQEEVSAPGYKRSNERITIMACSNASGSHKLPLMMIGKSAKPRAFKQVSSTALSVYYKNQESACMNPELFKTWFHEEFVPKVEKHLKKLKLPRKAILFLDNAPSHPNENELCSRDIKGKFFPPSVTTLIQSTDQGVLENLKRHYEFQLLTSLLVKVEDGEELTNHLKKINLKDVVFWVSQSWNEVNVETLKNSWRKVIDFPEQEDLSEEVPVVPLLEMMKASPKSEEITENDLEEWVTGDDVALDPLDYTDEKIVSIGHKPSQESDSGTFEEITTKKISHSEALSSLEIVLEYIQQQSEATPADIFMIKKWQDLAAKKGLLLD